MLVGLCRHHHQGIKHLHGAAWLGQGCQRQRIARAGNDERAVIHCGVVYRRIGLSHLCRQSLGKDVLHNRRHQILAQVAHRVALLARHLSVLKKRYTIVFDASASVCSA